VFVNPVRLVDRTAAVLVDKGKQRSTKEGRKRVLARTGQSKSRQTWFQDLATATPCRHPKHLAMFMNLKLRVDSDRNLNSGKPIDKIASNPIEKLFFH